MENNTYIEIIVVDDSSTDRTLEIVRGIPDSRIILLRNENNIGHVLTFEKAIKHSSGDIIYLCDQDDIWPDNRINLIENSIPESNFLFVGGFTTFTNDSYLNNYDTIKEITSVRDISFFDKFKNFIFMIFSKRKYFGSCMAFSSDFKNILLPFYHSVHAHDHWISIIGTVKGSLIYSSDTVTFRRLHDKNLTPKRKRPWPKIIFSKLNLIRLFIVAILRVKW